MSSCTLMVQLYFNDKAALSVLETLVFQQVKSLEVSVSL